MTETVLRKIILPGDRHALVAGCDDAEGLLRKIRNNRDSVWEHREKRNPRHHKLYWGLVNFVGEHSDLFWGAPREQIHQQLKIATGLFDTIVEVGTGRTFVELRSTSHRQMDQTEFSRYFDDACRVIANQWLPQGTTPESVRDELLLMIDGPHALGSKVL